MGEGAMAQDRTRAEAAQLFCYRGGAQAGRGSGDENVAPSRVDTVVR